MDVDIMDRLSEISAKNYISSDDLLFLSNLSECEDEDIRMDVAELLVFSDAEDSKKTLMKLATDSNILVRVNACDSLAIFSDITVFNKLSSIARNDSSTLVKRYAILSATDVLSNIAQEIKNYLGLFEMRLRVEKNIGIRLSCYRALYKFKDTGYLQAILAEVDGKKYQNRCFAINILMELLDGDNCKTIENKMIERRRIEKTIAVLSTIDKCLGRTKGRTQGDGDVV